jgi:glycosyltransferase involved in cell wall biosynthesis
VVILLLGRSGGLSGGDIHALRLAEAWSRRPDFDVVLVGDAGLAEFVQDAPDLIHVRIRTPFDGRMSSSSAALIAGLVWRGLASVRRCRGADQVVASSHLVFDVFPAGLARLFFKARLVSFVYHIIGEMDRPAGTRASAATLLESFSLWILRSARAVTFVDNDEARAGLIERGHRPELLFDTTNAYDPASIVPRPEPAVPRRLVFVGRLVEQKGVLDVLAVAQRLTEAGSDWQIDVVGNGPEHQRLADEVQRHGLSNLHLHGFVDERTKWSILSAGSLFLAPSREEGWGIAVGEALLAGLPVIAVDLPAYRHFRVPLDLVPSGGSPFVDRVMEIVNDPDLVRHAADALVGTSEMLPRWSDVLDGDLAVLTASRPLTASP